MPDKVRFYVLGLYILLIPFDNVRLLPLSLSTLMGMLFIVLSVSPSVSYRKNWLVEMIPFFLSFLLFLLSSVGFIQDTSLKKGNDSLFNTTLLYFILISVTAIVVSEERNTMYFKRILYFVFFSTLIASLTGLYELLCVLVFNRFPFGTAYIQYFKLFEMYILRIRGTYFDPNYFSIIPLLVIITANYLFSNKVLKVGVNLLMIILILSTFSRMGIVCLMVYYAITFVSKRVFYYVVIPISVIISPILVYQFSQFVQSLLEFNPNSVDHRFQIIQGSIQMILANPIWGYGFNVKSPIGLEAHNTYLQLLMYGGVLGLLLVFLPILFCYFNFYSLPIKDDEACRIRKLLLGILFPFLIAIFFLSYLTIKFFWIFVMIFFLGKNVLVAKNET